MRRRSAWLLAPGCDAQILIIGFHLKFNHLHEYCGSVTGASALCASNGAPVDVRTRMNIGSADDRR
jgi:hypothetical protein